jgi:hypothetical protein
VTRTPATRVHAADLPLFSFPIDRGAVAEELVLRSRPSGVLVATTPLGTHVLVPGDVVLPSWIEAYG